ncbi:hypothetical protein LOZ80_01425 [Paenibacillus sp. HWE-109]|uniref:hypothetical protein n=1 Tax=Paenibacillus sp. HWE-109 TaxID=1306526 RepID=UPI001EDFB3FD|nr:hypothetical protein [Paenibacillus sp. HWE-109]UKS27638.1 hypothetical protein LOZ80_01425 [Paenibacillus sp. HWE-109]
MSIFQLHSKAGYPIDASYIQSCDLEIRNLHVHDLDILIQVNNDFGIFHYSLHNLSGLNQPGSTLVIPEIYTHHAAFSFLLITNLLTTSTTALTLFAKNNGQVIAIFTQNEFIKFE